MTGWDVSRHPEWDMMYRAGLTVREIADHCRRDPRTVHRHVQIRETYEPGFHSEHLANLHLRSPDRPRTRWRQKLAKVEEFVNLNGRLPEYSNASDESSLYRWLSCQRRKLERNELSNQKIVLLNSLPCWNEPKWQIELDLRWENRLQDLELFVTTHKRMPRYKNYLNESERQVGVWLHSQHQKRSNGTLNPIRLSLLDQRVPGWHSKY